jgi:hypothetical protein
MNTYEEEEEEEEKKNKKKKNKKKKERNDVLILIQRTRWRSVFNPTSRQLYLLEMNAGSHRTTAWWAPELAWTL